MTHFDYRAGELCAETVPLARLAQQFGTPLYVYSASAVRGNYRRLAAAFAPLRPLICYAVKANSNLAIMDLVKAEGAGFDIVSGGELHRALKIGANPARLVFAGVGKTEAEISAALRAGVGWFNVESADELERLNALAAMRRTRATAALRLNPDVEPETHPHIRTGGSRNKFGLPIEAALALAARGAAAFPAVDLRGAHVHIGSQVPDPAFTLRAVEAALAFVAQVPTIETLNLGGGFPVAYRETDHYPTIEAFATPIVERLTPLVDRLSFHIEPGRYLVATAGVLVTTVQAVKDVAGRCTLVVDAGMNALLRPALYDAYHRVLPLNRTSDLQPLTSDVVGPICESADVLARDRQLPAMKPGDQLAVMDVGAYGFSMASQYNSQPRPAEILVDGDQARLVRRRETWEDLTALEAL